MNLTINIPNISEDAIKDIIDYAAEVALDTVRTILDEGIVIIPPEKDLGDAGISVDPGASPVAEDSVGQRPAEDVPAPEEERQEPPTPFQYDRVEEFNRAMIDFAIAVGRPIRFQYRKPPVGAGSRREEISSRVITPRVALSSGCAGTVLIGGEDEEGYKSFRFDRITGFVSLAD